MDFIGHNEKKFAPFQKNVTPILYGKRLVPLKSKPFHTWEGQGASHTVWQRPRGGAGGPLRTPARLKYSEVEHGAPAPIFAGGTGPTALCEDIEVGLNPTSSRARPQDDVSNGKP